MLHAACDMVVTTIALEEDAPQLCWGGDDDCFGGRNTLVFQPIAREAPLGADYR